MQGMNPHEITMEPQLLTGALVSFKQVGKSIVHHVRRTERTKMAACEWLLFS